MRTSLIFGAFVSIAALNILPGVANASLETSVPLSEQAQEEQDANLTLKFPIGVVLAETKIEVLDARSRKVAIETPQPGGTDADVNVPLREPLQPGVYTVKWRGMSSAGQRVQGSYNFNVDP